MSKKIVSAILTLTTIMWLGGFATFVPAAQAATDIVEGDLIRGPDGIKVYIVNNTGAKRHIFNPAVFDMYEHFSWASIKDVSQDVLDSYVSSDMYRADGDPKVYSLEEVDEASGNAMKHWLDMTAAEFLSEGYSWDNVFVVNPVERDYYSTGSPLTVGGTTPVSGTVTAMLASDTPAAGTLVHTQATADLAHFTFTNTGSAAVAINGLTFNRLGVSADGTLSNVYLFDGTLRITDAASLSGGSVSFNATGGLFTIPGYSSKTVALKSDILTGTSGQTVGVSLVSVSSTATVGGSLPINGAIHSIASATLASVAIGSATPSSAATTDPVSDVRVWQSTFTVGTRKVNFTRLALRQINSIQKADIQNFRLLIDGIEVASVASLDDDGYITFVFDKELGTGIRTVKVLADVIGGSSRIVQMSLRNKADLFLIDSDYGVNIAASGVSAAVSTATITVNSGTMTVEKASDSPSGDVVTGGTDVILGKWKFTAHGEPIKVETLTAGYAHVTTGGTTTVASTLRNGRLLVDGVQVGSNTTTAKTGTAFTTNFTVTPGTSAVVEFRADLYDNDGTDANLTSTDKVTAKLFQVSANASRTVSLGTTDAPTADTSANQVTVAGGDMTLAKRTSYADQTVGLPQTAFKVGEWTLTGGSSEVVSVHTLSLNIGTTTGTTFDYSDITDFYIVYGSETSSVKSTASAADNDWSVSFDLAKNEVMIVSLYANLGSSVTSTHAFKTDLTATGTGANSGASISTNSSDIDGQTITYTAPTITATRAAGTPDAAIVADNQNTITAAYKFETLYDAFTITELRFTVTDASAVANINIKDGSTVLATLPGSTDATFDGISIPVAANSSKTLTVELELVGVGTGAGTPGAEITTDYTSAKATPASTGVEVTVDDNTASGNAMYVYKAIPTIAKVVDADVQLRNEQETLLKFSIASTGGDISWDKLFFDITKDANTVLATPLIYDVTGGGQTLVAGAKTETALTATTTAASILFNATTEVAVSGTRTYELRATVTAADADGDYVTTSLHQDATHAAPTSSDAVTSVDPDAAITWSDISATSHATSTADWSGDYVIKSLPIENSLNW